MEKKFNIFLVISVVFHSLIIGFVGYLILKKSFSFKIKEKETIISVRRMTTKNFSFKHKISKKDKSSSHKTNQYTADAIKEIVNINKKIEVSLTKNDKSLKTKENIVNDLKFKQDIPDILNDEDFSSFDVEKEIKTLNSKGISFLDGESRRLLDNKNKELAALNLQTNTNCKIKIHINSDGLVEYAEIMESTGSLEKDNAILSIIKKWRFEKSVKNIQTAQVKIKYYLK